MVRCFVNNELERTLKEAIVAEYEILRKTTKTVRLKFEYRIRILMECHRWVRYYCAHHCHHPKTTEKVR
jgi:hypothetical protein